MGFKEIMTKLGKLNRPTRPDLPDDVTTDKALRTLRRQRRVQMEEVEKVKLKQKIADFNRDRTREHLFGIKDRKIKKPQQNRFKKKQSFLGKVRL